MLSSRQINTNTILNDVKNKIASVLKINNITYQQIRSIIKITNILHPNQPICQSCIIVVDEYDMQFYENCSICHSKTCHHCLNRCTDCNLKICDVCLPNTQIMVIDCEYCELSNVCNHCHMNRHLCSICKSCNNHGYPIGQLFICRTKAVDQALYIPKDLRAIVKKYMHNKKRISYCDKLTTCPTQ